MLFVAMLSRLSSNSNINLTAFNTSLLEEPRLHRQWIALFLLGGEVAKEQYSEISPRDAGPCLI